MTSPRPHRILAAAGGLLALTVALSGCAAIQNLTGHLAGLTVAPKVGDCWRVSYADAQNSEDWEGSGAVPCTQKHETYTYAMTHLTEKFTGSWLDSKGNPRADVDTAAFRACLAEQQRLLPGITAKEALLYPTYYIPSVAQWNSGARWVRCDLTEIKIGSTYENPQLTALPAAFSSLVATLKSNPKEFAFCEDDPANNGPDGNQTVYASCTGPSDWTLIFTKNLPGADGSAFPGTTALKALGDKQCVSAYSTSAHVATAIYPSSTTWTKYDDRELDCWLNNN
jgi:hypothetical protein